MKRRDFLKGCGAATAAASLPQLFARVASAAPGERPNILWLDAEDYCPEMGCYGTPAVQTPNLDRLAAQGARFTRAYCSGPVCSASRSAIMTGMYQTSIGAHHHRSDRGEPLPEGVRFITDYLREAGYFCVNGNANNPKRRGKLDFNFKMNHKQGYDGTDWRQRKDGQPFFAQMHFSETHRTFHADPERPVDPDEVEIPPYYPDHPITRLDWALYLETVQHLDRKVGRVLDRLKEDGLAENTVVFFTGDHGRAMVRGKQWLYEGGVHVPLLIRWPGQIEPGTVRDDLINFIDLAPTWLNIAGVDAPDHFQGRDILDSSGGDRKYLFAARDRCDETDDRIRMVMSQRYKYIRNFYPMRPYTQFNAYKKRQYPVLTLLQILHEKGELEPAQEHFMAPHRPVEELYDLKNDPHEVNNLAQDEDHRELVKDMRHRLDRWIYETGDQGQVPEPPEDRLKNDRHSENRWKNYAKKFDFDPLEEPEKYLEWWRQRLHQMKKA